MRLLRKAASDRANNVADICAPPTTLDSLGKANLTLTALSSLASSHRGGRLLQRTGGPNPGYHRLSTDGTKASGMFTKPTAAWASLPLAAALYLCAHHSLAAWERTTLRPPGRMIPVGDHRLHVFAQGTHTPSSPTLIVLPALGVTSAAYYYSGFMQLLSARHRVVTLDRAGMGYSDPSSHGKGLDQILEETRTALAHAGEKGPFVLLPHSIAGFEARYWASKYPDEVAAIIGLDALLPEYELEDWPDDTADNLLSKRTITTARALGIGRIDYLMAQIVPTKLYRTGLSAADVTQDKRLMRTSYFCEALIAENEAKENNARIVLEAPFPQCPVLLFVADHRQTSFIGKMWPVIAHQLATAHANVRVIEVDGDHQIHLHQGTRIAAEVDRLLATTACGDGE